MHDFKSIPEHSRYAITKCGILKNVITGTICKFYINDSGYPCLRIWDDGKSKYVIRRVHRLLMLTWSAVPENYLELEVNHIDGNKLNYDYSNLEWSTVSGNVKHALAMKLNPNSFDISVFDKETKVQYLFASLTQCGTTLRIPLDRLRKQLQVGHLIDARYIMKSHHDPRSWVEVESISYKEKQSFKFKRYDGNILAKNSDTGEVLSFTSVSASASKLKIDRGSVKKRLDANSMVPLKGWMFKLETDPTEWKVWTKEELKLTNMTSGIARPIEVTSEIDDSFKEVFSSVADFARYLGMNPKGAHNITTAIRTKGKFREYFITYINPESLSK